MVLVTGSVAAGTSQAQDATLTATPPMDISTNQVLIDVIPDVDAFGEGWSSVMVAPLDLPADTFRAGAMGVLTGPDGARVMSVAMLVTDQRIAVRRSWEAANDLFRKYSGELEYESDRDEILDRQPLPAGCLEAKRIDGTARQLGLDTTIPMGLTLCAADPDLIVLAVVSGGIGPLAGYQASDAVASLMLGAIRDVDQVTPVAGMSATVG